MKDLVFAPAAIADIEQIWDYSAEHWGADQADRYTDEIRDACMTLATGHRHCRLVPERAGYLKYATGSHMIYFREASDRLDVIRVLHQAQDPERHV